jgi:hypothetical protein
MFRGWRPSLRLPEWRWWPAIPLAALFFLALLGAWLPIPPPQKNAIAASQKIPEGKTKQIDPNERLANYTLWLTIFSGALAVLGGLELYWIVRQETWMKKSVAAAQNAVKETRRIGEAQVRAYVKIKQVTIDFIDMGEKIGADAAHVHIIASNAGQSPARNFAWNPVIQYMGGKRKALDGGRTRSLEDVLGASISTGDPIAESVIVPAMSPSGYAAGSEEMIEQFFVRIRIDFAYTDVFDRRITDSAQFAGNVISRVGKKAADQWVTMIGPVNQPGRWENHTEEETQA